MASQFSCFAPSGIRFTRRKPRAEVIYDTLREAWGSLFTDDPDASVNVETFAQAKCLALAHEQLERAGNQANPKHCDDLLPKLEADYGITPPPDATIQERRDALIAAKAISGGALIGPVTDGLRAILGDGLIAVVPQDVDSLTTYQFPDTITPWLPDATIGELRPATVANFANIGDEFKVVALTTNSTTGTVGYSHVAGSTNPLTAGQKITVDCDGTGRTETVTITAATSSTFSASFAFTHCAGATCTTAAFPYWISGRRILFVVVSNSVLASDVLQQRANDFLRRCLTHATQWALVASSGTGTAGPFVIGESMLEQTPISEVTY
jgi:hypothetical protein